MFAASLTKRSCLPQTASSFGVIRLHFGAERTMSSAIAILTTGHNFRSRGTLWINAILEAKLRCSRVQLTSVRESTVNASATQTRYAGATRTRHLPKSVESLDGVRMGLRYLLSLSGLSVSLSLPALGILPYLEVPQHKRLS